MPAQGFRADGSADDDPAVAGAWSAPFQGGAPAVNMVLLHDGRVLYWSGVEAGDNDNVFFTGEPAHAEARLLAPPYTAANVTTPADPWGMAGDLFCSGQTVLPDGRVLAAGGSRWVAVPDDTGIVWGLRDARAFDPASSAWTRMADMAFERWYPTVLTDANGNALAASGIRKLTDPLTLNLATEVYDADADAWSRAPVDENLLPMYPRLFVVPGGPMKGDLFYQTTSTLWGPFGEHPLEALWSLQQVADKDTGAWRTLGPSAFGARQHGVTVPLALDPADGYGMRLLSFGGTLQRSVVATATAEVANLSTNPPTNSVVDALAEPRWHANGVLLPDGTVLAIGGGLLDNVVLHGQPNVPVLPVEQYDPATGAWSTRASMQVPRMYHSTALLLPDGRVLAGGHVPLPIPWKAVRDNVPGQAQIAERRLEIYSPPYLFRGERPVIASAPEAVAYGATFTVGTPDAADIESAVLIRPGSTTHAWDSAQRAVKLTVAARGDGSLSLVAPPDGDVAAPGYWMLFLNKGTPQGPVPSVAAFVKLGP